MSALTHDVTEHTSTFDRKQTRLEVREAHVEHMSGTILVRVKRMGPNKIREVKKISLALFSVRLVFRLDVNSRCCFVLRLTRTKRFIRPMMKATELKGRTTKGTEGIRWQLSVRVDHS